jgi:hypothetical protein
MNTDILEQISSFIQENSGILELYQLSKLYYSQSSLQFLKKEYDHSYESSSKSYELSKELYGIDSLNCLKPLIISI